MTRHEGYDRLRRMVELPAAAETVWAEIGDFGAIADWHPLIAKAEVVEIDGDIHRHLTTTDGDLILERLTGTGELTYSYEIIDGPLPVAGYRAVFSCVPEGEGCHIFWSAHFEALDPSADEIVAAIYEAGLRAIRDRFPPAVR